MPLYGIPQAGSNSNQSLNLTSVCPGDSFTHFDGTETPSAGLSSVAFSRGYSPGAGDNGTTWYIQYPLASPVATVAIQGSNLDINAGYQTLSIVSGNGAYTDTGRAAFYRLQLLTYTSGGMPVGLAQR